jgi:hypothetical protein
MLLRRRVETLLTMSYSWRSGAFRELYRPMGLILSDTHFSNSKPLISISLPAHHYSN